MNIMELRSGIVYTAKLLASYIYGADDAAALKRAERWITEKSLNFDCLNAENICDEHNRPAKKQVMAHVIGQHKVRRNALLFVKMVSAAAGKTFIFANDAKGTRRWIQLGDPKTATEIIETALLTLLEHENKNTVVIPAGSLTTICRELSRKWRSNEKRISGKTIPLRLRFIITLSQILKPTQIKITHLSRQVN